MDIGDQIIVTTAEGRFVYRMTAMDIVNPSASDVISTSDPSVARLTLTTCHPEYSAQQRLIVFADLEIASSAIPAPYVPATPPTDLASEDPAGPVGGVAGTYGAGIADEATSRSAYTPMSRFCALYRGWHVVSVSLATVGWRSWR